MRRVAVEGEPQMHADEGGLRRLDLLASSFICGSFFSLLRRTLWYDSRMTLPLANPRYTVEEYLRMEESAVDRHEYHDGEILAMSGGTYEHSLINVNVISSLKNRLR